jgi:hypothetical protein
VAELNPLDALRKRLAIRISDPKLMLVPGLKDDLRAIHDGFVELERRVGVVAVVQLNNHYWPSATMHEALWRALSEMSDRARAVYNTGEHEPRCTCEQCCLYRLVKPRVR